MKSFLTTGIFILTSILLGNAQAPKMNACSTAKKHENLQKSGNLTIAQTALTKRYDVHYYRFDLNMSNLNTNISGTVEMQANAIQNIDTILIELFNSFTISELKVNDVITTNFTHTNNVVRIISPISAGANFKIETTYAGTAPNQVTNPMGGAGLSNDVSPNWGVRATWSLSEPYSAHEWFPVKQDLRDKIDSLDLNFTVPSSCKAGSNGLLKNTIDLGNGSTRYEWKHRHKIAYYLISVAIAPYQEYSIYAHPANSPDSILIQNFIYNTPTYLTNFKNDIDETVDFIELFSDLFGLYPFHDEKYGHCIAPLSGGMEHQTMTTQGFFEKSLTAHELAHQWWGDYVTCASWSDIWVNEGFASYSEYLMLEALYPNQKANDMTQRHNDIMSNPGGSVWVSDSTNVNAIFSSRLTYNKGAAFVHTLRFLINDDVLFYSGLTNFLTEYKDSFALAIDIKHALELASEINLDACFEEWFYGEGFPTYSAKWNVVNDICYIQITHTTSSPQVTPTFTNDVEIRLGRIDAADTIVRISIQSNDQTVALPNLGNVSALKSIDPNNWIINKVGSIQKDETLTTTNYSSNTELFNVFPNPSSGPFKVTAATEGNYTLKIIDSRGKWIQTTSFSQEITINLSNFARGTYLLQIESADSQIKTHKLVHY